MPSVDIAQYPVPGFRLPEKGPRGVLDSPSYSACVSPVSQRSELPRRLSRVLLRPRLYSPTSWSHLPGLFRQFDSVGMFLVALVLFGKNLFQPLCLLFCNPFIDRRGIVAYEEIFAANLTPEGSHLQETYSLLAATLLYSHCLHLSLPVCLSFTSLLYDRSSQTQTLERRSGLSAALVRNNF